MRFLTVQFFIHDDPLQWRIICLWKFYLISMKKLILNHFYDVAKRDPPNRYTIFSDIFSDSLSACNVNRDTLNILVTISDYIILFLSGRINLILFPSFHFFLSSSRLNCMNAYEFIHADVWNLIYFAWNRMQRWTGVEVLTSNAITETFNSFHYFICNVHEYLCMVQVNWWEYRFTRWWTRLN